MNKIILEKLQLAVDLYSEGESEPALMELEDAMPLLIKEVNN